MVNIDSIIDNGRLLKQQRIKRYTVNWPIGYSRFRDENIDTDAMPTAIPGQAIPYQQYILNSNPVHYYRFGETTATTVATDIGSGAHNGTYAINANSAGFNVGGALYTDSDRAKKFTSSRRMLVTNGLVLGTTGATINFSLEFWFKPSPTTSEEYDGFLGYRGTNSGWVCAFRKGNMFFTRRYSGSDVTIDLGGHTLTKEMWHHIVWTIDTSGVSTVYVNGSQVNRRKLGNTVGLVIPNPATTVLDVGGTNGYQDIPSFSMDELSIYTHVLSQSEIQEHFSKGFVNQGIANIAYQVNTPVNIGATSVTLTDSLNVDPTLIVGQVVVLTNESDANHESMTIQSYDDSTMVMTFTSAVAISGHDLIYFVQPLELLRAQEQYNNRVLIDLPTLTDEEDVTDYISKWSISKSAQSLITSATLDAHYQWGSRAIADKFKPMSYLIIEQRYVDPANSVDTGWMSVAHLLTDGPIGEAVSATGEKVYRIIAKGVLKLLNNDLANYNVEPDIIKVTRREAVQSYQDTDVTTFRIPRAGSSNPVKYYYDWTDKPRPRLWASQFGVTGDIISNPDILPIKSSEGSIQIVGGEGKIVFNTNAFQDLVKNNGFGYPSKLEVELYRYATYEDIVKTTIVNPISVTVSSQGAPTKATIYVDKTQFVTDEDYTGRTIFIKSGACKGCMFKIFKLWDDPSYTGAKALDVKTLDGVIPDLTTFTLAVNDSVQVTDCNLLEDALWKVCMRKGFQQRDSSKPFYFDVASPNVIVQLPPLNYYYSDNVKDLELFQEILDYGPPNYYSVETPDGKLQTVTVVQKDIGYADHDLTNGLLEISTDSTDYGVYDRVIAIGEGTGNFNVAMHVTSGGFATSGAYKLTDWYGLGTISQSSADNYVRQILDLNPKTPQVAGSAPYNYGLLYESRSSSTKRWTFADADIMWIDLGKNTSTGNPWLIDQIDVTTFSSFRDGTLTTQSLIIDYMTEEEYISRTGHIPPAYPNLEYSTIATNMLALKPTSTDSKGWKCLVDEFNTPEGQTTVNASEFINGRGEYARFLKIRCGQAWFRASDSSHPNICRIVLAGLKVWLSRRIVQTAELGVDQGFDSATYDEIANRLRRRTVVLERNLSLDSNVSAKKYALNELRELYSEFTPKQVVVVDSGVDIHDTVQYTDFETSDTETYVVRTITRESNGPVQLQIIDYREFSDV